MTHLTAVAVSAAPTYFRTEAERSTFLSKVFRQHVMVGEALVYHWASKLAPAYTGGYWTFYSVAKSRVGRSWAYYMAPDETTWQVEAPNGWCCVVSSDALGIICTLYALNYLANRFVDDWFIDLYYALRDVASVHPEAVAILRAID